MLYFCLRQEIGEIEALAEKYFERDDNPNIRTPEELEKYHTWRTKQEMDGVRRSFMISEHLGECVPDSGEYRTFLRVYDDTLERMLEGPGAARAIEQAMEMYEGHTISIGRSIVRGGNEIFVRAKSAITPPHIREFLRNGVIPMTWPTLNSPFAKFMNDLWDGEGWIVYDGKTGELRKDLAYAIAGENAPEPEGLGTVAVERVVFTPDTYTLRGIKGVGVVGGGAAVEVLADGKIQEHDEDGSPVGEPHNPNEFGGEDPVSEPAPAITTESHPGPQLIVTGTDEDGAPCELADNSVAAACDVDTSRFEPSPHDD